MTSVQDDFSSLLDLPANATVARGLALAGFAVFPVRNWNDGDVRKPIKGFLERATVDLKQIDEWWHSWPDACVGLLCGERNGVSVLDLDRKAGKDGVASLAALGFSDLEALSPVRVKTPSGGYHLYFRYDPRLKNSVSRIGSGIDVRTAGGFVIAPGSYRDGHPYAVEGLPLGAVELPSFPNQLVLDAPATADAPAPLQQASDEQRDWAVGHLQGLAGALAEYGEGGRNDFLNTAAMWAGGAAAHGFLTREIAETALLAAAEACGLPKREARKTFGSGWSAGLKKPISAFPREIDVDDLEDLPELDEFDALLKSDFDGVNPVTKRLNLRHAVVVVRGRTLATTEQSDGTVDFGTVRDLHTFYANDLVRAGKDAKGKPKFEPASMRWLRDIDRRTFPDGVTFSPGGCKSTVLNLWRGWAVEPDPSASCALFLNHLSEVVCRGDRDHYAYVVGWLAHMVQFPDQKPGVGLVLRGLKGAGKDTVADYVAKFIGSRHAPTVAQSDHIVGKFNARLESALMLHVQEGSWAGDRRAEDVLKYIVTSDRIEIERKGIDSINLPSVLRVFISANADWVVPASADERRWAVFEVSNKRKGDAEYFAALRSEMNGRGPAALLHFLRSYDLANFNVRAAPDTEGLQQQKIASLRNIGLWWFETLHRGILPGSLDCGGEWADQGMTLGRDLLRGNYLEWMRGRRYDGDPVDERLFGRKLREMLPSLGDSRLGSRSDRSWKYVLPMLADCRAEFGDWLGGPVDWK